MKRSQGHGSNNSSGSSTSLTPGGGTLTPVSGDVKDAEFTGSNTVTENFQRKGSFQKARIFGASSSDVRSSGLKKEHQEQGSVKKDVYMQYIYAASKIGFTLYLFATASQQAASVLASLTLRYWGEHNQQLGNNSGMFQYLLIYGLFSFSSSILGATSAIILWVYCTVRSAKQLHDSVRSQKHLCFWRDSNLQKLDARFSYARSSELLRTNTHWTVSCFDPFLNPNSCCIQNFKPVLTRHICG